MDRLSWYVAGESMEEILIQSGHVSIYEGDSKHTEFDQGTASLTWCRIIWADPNDPARRLVLHHSLIRSMEKHNKSMFSRGGKIVLHLDSPPSGNHGPVKNSPHDLLRFVFRSGGEEEFFKRYEEAMKRKSWQRSSSGSSSSGSRASGNLRSVGISGIEKRLAENHIKTHETITQAFDDMTRLMESARDMVKLSKTISEKVRTRKGEITDDETVAFKSYLLSLGVSDPVTKSAFVGSDSEYFMKLAEELTNVLAEPLKECGGMMALPEVYCRINRARGLELLSPEDLLHACEALSRINSPLELHHFPSGVFVVQLKSASVENMVDVTRDFVETRGKVSANDLAIDQGLTVILAKERFLKMADLEMSEEPLNAENGGPPDQDSMQEAPGQGEGVQENREELESGQIEDGSDDGSSLFGSDDDDDNVQVTIQKYDSINVPFTKSAASGQQHLANKLDLDHVSTIGDKPIYDIDLAQMEDRPWRRPGADLTDYFNYGFTEDTWNTYCERQKKLRVEFSGNQTQANKALFSSITLAHPLAMPKSATEGATGGLKVLTDNGGKFKPYQFKGDSHEPIVRTVIGTRPGQVSASSSASSLAPPGVTPSSSQAPMVDFSRPPPNMTIIPTVNLSQPPSGPPLSTGPPPQANQPPPGQPPILPAEPRADAPPGVDLPPGVEDSASTPVSSAPPQGIPTLSGPPLNMSMPPPGFNPALPPPMVRGPPPMMPNMPPPPFNTMLPPPGSIYKVLFFKSLKALFLDFGYFYLFF
ncbi:hypothetical protein WR25_23350 [Diploscapter pachys]|uniref:Vacuolar protein-sorting-associated protein 36 n=1 Tax=Diploscapter pachys TaxID=2018661 RepID=A0A2A2K282_9BILA|nr:hypothetical protein WR25_23350 [Diploscapter pachys]